MSYSTFIDEIQAALEAVAEFTYSQQPRLASVAKRSSFNFEGAFAIHNETGAMPWPELSRGPSHWWSTILVEVGIQVKEDNVEDDKRVAQYSRQVINAVAYSSFNDGCVYQIGTSQKQRTGNDGRIIHAQRFNIRWTE